MKRKPFASTEFIRVATTTSFNVERSKTNSKEVSDETQVSIELPANKQIMIDLLRKKIDIVYKWKGTFKLLGKYHLSWSSGDETTQDITTVLTGPHRALCVC